MVLLAHKTFAKDSKNELQKELFSIFGKQAIYYLFPYKVHCFYYYYNTFIVATL